MRCWARRRQSRGCSTQGVWWACSPAPELRLKYRQAVWPTRSCRESFRLTGLCAGLAQGLYAVSAPAGFCRDGVRFCTNKRYPRSACVTALTGIPCDGEPYYLLTATRVKVLGIPLSYTSDDRLGSSTSSLITSPLAAAAVTSSPSVQRRQ